MIDPDEIFFIFRAIYYRVRMNRGSCSETGGMNSFVTVVELLLLLLLLLRYD